MRTKHYAGKMADIVVVLDKLKEELTCSICLKLLEEPKTLPCLHSFCEKCLKDNVSRRPLVEELDPPDTRDFLPCPICKSRVRLDVENDADGGGVGRLKTNPCLKNLVEHYQLSLEVAGRLQKSVSRCGFCSAPDNEAVAFCQTRCNRFLCQVCFQGHKLGPKPRKF